MPMMSVIRSNMGLNSNELVVREGPSSSRNTGQLHLAGFDRTRLHVDEAERTARVVWVALFFV